MPEEVGKKICLEIVGKDEFGRQGYVIWSDDEPDTGDILKATEKLGVKAVVRLEVAKIPTKPCEE